MGVAPDAHRVPRGDSRLVHEVADRLRTLIASGTLAPGTRLHQEQLAERLGVSRTPIREALLELEREGLVAVDPGRGRFVRSASLDEVLHVYEARLELEPVGARLACERATPAQRADVVAVQREHERQARGPRAADHLQRWVDLHRGVVAPCANPVLLEFLRVLWAHDDNHRLFRDRVVDGDAVTEVIAEHAAIVAAYADGDAESVERLMRGHIRRRSPVLP